jgi:hypothetical protein
MEQLMRINFILLLLSIISFAPISIYAQNTAKYLRADSLKKCLELKQKLLNGTWRMKSVEIPGIVYNQEQRKDMESAFQNHTLTYTNGKVLIKTPSGNDTSFEVTNAIWTIQNDCETIKIFNLKDKSVTITHFSVSESKLILDRKELGVVTFVAMKAQ